MVGLIIFIIAMAVSLAWLRAGGIDYIKQNHPDYKGKDLFDDEDKNSIS